MSASRDGIPLLDLDAHHAPLLGDIRAAMDRVLRSNGFILGPEVDAFEDEIAQALGVPHAIGVSSGTDALLVSLMALGIGQGDEVITTPFTFFATAGCISRLGARPVFADVEPDTLNLDPACAESCVGERTRAIVPVHAFGRPVDLVRFREVARRHDLALVEDAAQAIGARRDGETVGSTGDLAAFSFFPTKNLGALGDGGLVTTRDAELAERVRMLRVHGAEPKYHHSLVGGNFRLDALQAAVLRVKLPHLARWTAARRQHAERYERLLAEAGLVPRPVTPPAAGCGHVYNQYVVRAEQRDALREHLAAEDIATGVYYPKPLHLQPCFAHLGYEPGALPNAEQACEQALALPLYPELDEASQRRVVAAIARHYGG